MSMAAWGNDGDGAGLTALTLIGNVQKTPATSNQDEHAKPIAPVRLRPMLTNIRDAAEPSDKATRQPSRVGFSNGVKGMGLLLAAFLLSVCSLMLNDFRQGRKPEPMGPSSGDMSLPPDNHEYRTTRASASESTGRERNHTPSPALDFFEEEAKWH